MMKREPKPVGAVLIATSFCPVFVDRTSSALNFTMLVLEGEEDLYRMNRVL